MLTIKQEAYHNLPDKFRRQHGRFEFYGMERGTPCAQARHLFTHDLLNEMGVLDDSQVGCALYFTLCRDAAHRRPRTIFDTMMESYAAGLPDSPSSQADLYYKLVKRIPKKQFNDIVLYTAPIEPTDSIPAMRRYLYALAPAIASLFDMLEITLDEFRTCNT